MGKENENEYVLTGYDEAVSVIEDKLITGDLYKTEVEGMSLEIAANFPETVIKPAEEAVPVSARVTTDDEAVEIDELDFTEKSLPGYSFTIVFTKGTGTASLLVYRKS